MKPKHWQSPGLAAALEQAGLARNVATNELMDNDAAARQATATTEYDEQPAEENDR